MSEYFDHYTNCAAQSDHFKSGRFDLCGRTGYTYCNQSCKRIQLVDRRHHGGDYCRLFRNLYSDNNRFSRMSEHNQRYCFGNALCRFMENDLDNAISVYPNPASGDLNLKWNASGTNYFDIHLYNSIGEEVMRSEKIKTNSVTENKIDISSLPNGIYLLVMKNALIV